MDSVSPLCGMPGFAGTLPRYPSAVFGELLHFVFLLPAVPSEHTSDHVPWTSKACWVMGSAGAEFPLLMSDTDTFKWASPRGCFDSGRDQDLLVFLPFPALHPQLPFPAPATTISSTYHLYVRPHLGVAFEDQPKAITLGSVGVV